MPAVFRSALKVWWEEMEDWQEIDKLPALKRILWDYPDAPKPREPKEGPSVQEQRWFYVDEHEGEEGKEREIVGPTTKEVRFA